MTGLKVFGCMSVVSQTSQVVSLSALQVASCNLRPNQSNLQQHTHTHFNIWQRLFVVLACELILQLRQARNVLPKGMVV